MLETAFTQLVGCRVPLQQAGMGGVATPELAAAVADAGGLGMVSMVRAPAEHVASELDRLASMTAGAVGINFLMPFLDEAAVEAAASRSRVVEFFYGDPATGVVERVHQGGALACWQVGSVDEARSAVDAGCEFVIAQGNEAGGHVRGHLPLLPLLEGVLDIVDGPVLAAGGIATARAVAAVLAAGAAGARIGTRFVACAESDAHPEYVKALIAAEGTDTTITETFSVMWPHAPHRVLRSCIDAATAFEGDVVGQMMLGSAAMPIPKFAAPCPTRTTTGHVDAMALYAGQAVGMVHEVATAADIVRELAEGAAALLGRG